MAISPFEERYATKMNGIFEEEAKIRRWMRVEVALAKAHAKLGTIPKEVPNQLSLAMDSVKLDRVLEIESQIHHDLMAMVKAFTEKAGDAGKYIHLGATSYDIEDTATAMMFVEALDLLLEDSQGLLKTVKKLSLDHIDTVCVGRTHGQHAVPTTYGLKFAIYYQELLRNIERLKDSKKQIAFGKMSGAVGTMATFGDKAFEIEKFVMNDLNLSADLTSNQVIQRDRHAHVLCSLAIYAATLEKIAKELRNLQRSEIGEVYEYYGAKQVGSSTMPQKRNPHKSERVCSLARLVRSNVQVAIENMALEHERDLTNSANERTIFSGSFVCLDYMILEMTKILSGLQFHPENIKRNLDLSLGLIMSERLMIHLVEKKNVGRQEAHEQVRNIAQEAFEKKLQMKDLVIKKGILSKDEAEKLFDYSTYVGKAREIVQRATK
jgi:adenylosuccinate lyase